MKFPFLCITISKDVKNPLDFVKWEGRGSGLLFFTNRNDKQRKYY
jgi:hypothetical protein